MSPDDSSTRFVGAPGAETGRSSGRGLFFWERTCPRYRLENYRSALDAPGEWFLDAKASKLRYIPRPGETLAATTAFAPVVETIVRFAAERAAWADGEWREFEIDTGDMQTLMRAGKFEFSVTGSSVQALGPSTLMRQPWMPALPGLTIAPDMCYTSAIVEVEQAGCEMDCGVNPIGGRA